MKSENLNDIDFIYSQLESNSNKIVISYDLTQKKLRYISSSVEKLFGFSKKVLMQQNTSWISNETIDDILNCNNDDNKNFENSFIEKQFNLIHKNSSIVPCLFKLLFIKNKNETIGFLAVIEPLPEDTISPLLQQYIGTLELTSHKGILVFNIPGDLIYINDEALSNIGFSKEELLGKNYLEFGESHFQKTKEAFKKYLNQGVQNTLIDIDMKKKDGSLIHARCIVSAIRNKDGIIEAYVIACKEIENNLSEKLEAYQQNFFGFLEACSEPAGLLDVNLNILALGGTALGNMSVIKNPEKIINTQFLDYVDDDQKAFLLKKRDELITQKKKQSFGIKIQDRDYNMLVYPIFNNNGEVNRIIGFAKDVTNLKLFADHLMKSEIRYQRIIQTMTEGLLITDENLKIIYVNNSVIEKTGMPESTIIGNDIRFLLTSESREKVEKSIELTISEGRSRVIADLNISEKEIISVMLSSTNIVNEKGKYGGIQVLASDITEYRRNQRSLEYKTEFQKIGVEISTDFVSYENNEIDDGIVDAMKKIGSFNNDNLVFINQFNESRTILFNSHLWHSKDYVLYNKERFSINLLPYPQLSAILFSGEVFQISNFENFPYNLPNVIKLANKINIKAGLLIPIKIKEEILGVLGFASSDEKVWSDDTVSFYKMMGSIFINAIERKRISFDLAREIMNRLSTREKEFFQYLLEGYQWPSDKRLIGKKMDVLPGTLDKFMIRIKEKVRSDELDGFIESIKYLDMSKNP